jgi:GT2 family glycosyltransferase
VPDLSVAIVTYNTREPLRRCLQSIRDHHGGVDLEVIVVDNGSRDGSVTMAREVMPQALVVAPGRNTWFTGGNNIAIQKATGEYVWILNADTVLQPGTLPTMLAYLRAHPRVGAVSCQMRFPDGRVQRTGSRMPAYADLVLDYSAVGLLLGPWRDRRRARLWLAGWSRDSSRPVEVVPGSNLMAPLALVRQVGAFDERFKLYFAEDDLCRRILDAGREVHFVGDAVLVHEESASVRQVRRLATRVYFEDLLRFAEKHHGRARAGWLRALVWPTRQAMDLVQRLRGERTAVAR